MEVSHLKQLEIFGLDIENEEFWKEGIKTIKEMVSEFKNIYLKLKEKNG